MIQVNPATTRHMMTAADNPIVAAKPVQRGWIVLCDISAHNHVHPYVTWWMDVDGHTFHGNYFEHFQAALDDWFERL